VEPIIKEGKGRGRGKKEKKGKRRREKERKKGRGEGRTSKNVPILRNSENSHYIIVDHDENCLANREIMPIEAFKTTKGNRARTALSLATSNCWPNCLGTNRTSLARDRGNCLSSMMLGLCRQMSTNN
jgi:hypothetical protein